LKSRLAFETKETEITALFAVTGGLLKLLGAALSTWWFGGEA
jgi:Ca-activated chloride channel family protein